MSYSQTNPKLLHLIQMQGSQTILRQTLTAEYRPIQTGADAAQEVLGSELI